MIQSFKMAIRAIEGNKMRAFLTMLGIIIGVMALVILVSLVNGTTNSVTDTISDLGSNMLTVTVTDDKGSPVTLSTLDEWMQEDEIGAIAPYAMESMTAKYDTNSESIEVYGTTPAYADIQGLKIMLGRFLKRADVENNTNVCVISEDTATDLVGYLDCLGEQISLNGTKYTVVGVLEEDEDSLTSFFSGDSYAAYIPHTSLMRLSTSVSQDLAMFYVSAAANSNMESAETAMTKLLMERFEDDDDAFSVTAMDILEDAMGDITSILSILLGGIAAISLIVGGIGIMNIMLVSVTERTREIGIRKAIGASRRVILQQFLLESVVLCMMGILISWGFLQIVSVIVSSLSISFAMDGTVVVVAVVFCFAIGILFGLYPANKAAKMEPIDALHYNG